MNNIILIIAAMLVTAPSYGKGDSSSKDLSICVQKLISYDKGGSLYSLKRWPERIHQPNLPKILEYYMASTGKISSK